MKNKIIYIFMILTCLICFTNVKAENIDLNYDNNIKLLADENSNNDPIPVANKDCENTLGTNFSKDLQSIFNVFKIVAPILTLALSTYDFVVSITSKQAEGLQKSAKKFTTRLVLVVLLYLLPTIINVLLELVLPQGGNTCVR
ncbi:MAG: hypothetical protein MR765_01945 [Tenericutes bacterium]|nr:hypothetical protein [Mycoplasmatota bacterium]